MAVISPSSGPSPVSKFRPTNPAEKRSLAKHCNKILVNSIHRLSDLRMRNWLVGRFSRRNARQRGYSTTGEAYGRSLILIPAGITPFETLIEIRFTHRLQSWPGYKLGWPSPPHLILNILDKVKECQTNSKIFFFKPDLLPSCDPWVLSVATMLNFKIFARIIDEFKR